jgi:hypothetical protein
LPPPPPGPEDASIALYMKSSKGIAYDSEFSDSVGNTVSIGVILHLTQYIKSVTIKIQKEDSTEQSFTFGSTKDTVVYPLTFLSPGKRNVTVTGSIEGKPEIVLKGSFTIYSRTLVIENQKPVLTVPAAQHVGAGQSLVFPVSATDPDPAQQVTITVANKPATATFFENTFSWTPAMTDTGTVQVLFIGTDNGSPAKTDTEAVMITISASAVNHAPAWNFKTMQRSAVPGVQFLYLLNNFCSDRENDSLTFSLISGAPDKDTINGKTYSFTPTPSDTGKYTVRIIAKDPAGLADTQTVLLTVSATAIPDTIPPLIKFQSPSKDTTVLVDSAEIKVSCTDDNGINSVKGYCNNTAFDLKRSAVTASLWTGKIKGLTSGSNSTIKIVAEDSSSAKNKDSVSVKIKYDGDTIKPIITLVTPAADSVSTNSSVYTVTLQCTDASGILSVNGMMGTFAFNGVRDTGKNWKISLSELKAGEFNTILFTAIDSSLRANKGYLTLHIKNDPSMNDIDGPTITQKSGPTNGAIVSNAAIEITYSIEDPSGIDSVYWIKNNSVKKYMTPVSGNAGQYTLKDTLNEGAYDTLKVTSVDKSTRHNRSPQTVILKYIKAPAITVQPVSKAICSGSKAIFSVTATGTSPLAYQWLTGATNPANIDGAIFSSCTLSTTAATTILSCQVSNGASQNARSSLCTLTVYSPPVISGPGNASSCTGSATISVSVSGVNNLQYQWLKGTTPGSGASVPNATSSTYTVTSSGSYYCQISYGSGCTANSDVANVTVSSPPVISNPAAISVCQGDNGKTMSVSTTPSTGVTLQWYKGASGSGTALSNNSNYSGVTNPVLTFNGITSILDNTYYCVVTATSTGCSATSSAARLTVNTPPTISSGPVSTVACDGGTATMSVSAPGATQWTWYKVGSSSPLTNNSDYSTTGTQTLTINAKASTGGSYYCNVGNNGCTATSGTAELKVTTITTNPTSKSTCPGIVSTMQVAATNATTYRWWKDGSAISTSDANFVGVTSAQLSISGTPGNAGSYYCVVGNGNCTKESAHATLSIYPEINIITDLNPNFESGFCFEYPSIGFQTEANGGSGTLSQTWYCDKRALIKDVDYADAGGGYIYLNLPLINSFEVGSHSIYCEFSDSYCTKKTSTQYFTMSHCP